MTKSCFARKTVLGKSAAVFLALLFSIAEGQAVQLMVQVTPAGAGTTTITSTNVSTAGDWLPLSATASAGYTFGYWETYTNCSLVLGATNDSAVFVAVASTNLSIAVLRAHFNSDYKTLVVTSVPTNGGTTIPAGTNAYLKGTTVTVSATPAATPAPGYEFLGWSGAPYLPYGSNSVQVTMNSDYPLTATFGNLWNVTQSNMTGPDVASPYTFRLSDKTYTNISIPSDVTGLSGNQRYRCDGWTSGTGSVVPASKSGAQATVFSLSPITTNSSLVWKWAPQFKVTVVSNASGTVDIQELASPGDNHPNDQWVDSNTSVRVTVNVTDPSKYEPDYVSVNGERFDLSATYQTDVLVTNPVSIVPFFRVSSQDDPGFVAFMKRFGLVAGSTMQHTYDDPDGDGLSNEQEYKLSNTNNGAYYNPINADTDGDGMDDNYETYSVDPTNLTDQVRNSKDFYPAAVDNGAHSVDSGEEGNRDGDYHWSTTDGYMQPSQPLMNIEEYRGPDGTAPYTTVAVNYGDAGYPFPANPSGSRPTVYVRVAVAGDTGDQSKGNSANSDKDPFDDGFEYSWDQWQQAHSGSNEVILVGVTNAVPVYITNTVPDWATARVFNPGRTDTPGAGPDYEVLYDYTSGKVSDSYLTASLKYNAWKPDTFSPTVSAAPHTIRMDFKPDMPDGMTARRCIHPFLWDVDGDGLPDGYEVVFGYDPWRASTAGTSWNDGQDNPDGDWMAKSSTNDLTALRNHEVYLANGFDPRVAVDQLYPLPQDVPNGKGSTNSPTSAKYSNIDEMRGPDGLMALVPGPLADDATNPIKYDSDGDGMWDGWENYVGLDPNDPLDEALDPDNDKLSNLEEFQSFYTSSTNRLALTPLTNWMNKIFPTDPGIDPSPMDTNTMSGADTDGDGIKDGDEKGFFNSDSYGGMSLTNSTVYVTPDGAYAIGTKITSYGVWSGASFTGGGLNPATSDTDGDTLPDPYEASYAAGLDGTVGDTFMDPDGDGLQNYQEYWTCSVYHWQSDVWTNGLASYDNADFFQGTPKRWDWSQKKYIPLFGPAGKIGTFAYAGTYPTSKDSDQDGMDDYYEIYHGLDPLYGTLDLIACRNMGDNLEPANFTGCDPSTQPWTTGHPLADPDGDGLKNYAEAPNSLYPSQSPRIHTDPSPLWMTDRDYDRSWVNLYYKPSSSVWYWNTKPWAPPTYAFSFESNEGYDTDTDGVSDKEELNVTKTDPLTPERPVKRRALYLPPGVPAYARTYPGFVAASGDPGGGYLPGLDIVNITSDALRSFTVEAWVRPVNPASGTDQVIVERPLYIASGNQMNLTPGLRRNFRLAIGGDGRPYVDYTGDDQEPVYGDPKVTGTEVLSTNWTHLAATYQVPSYTNANQGGWLTLYVNGVIVAKSQFSQIPSTGSFYLGSPLITVVGAPIMVGAADGNPDGTFGSINEPSPSLFFKGWIDEVRVWDGARSDVQIAATMRKQLRQTDVLAQQSPNPTLKYLFTFDGRPDVDHCSTTTGTPLGFDLTATKMFPSGWAAAFWDATPQKSLVYSDYRYVPWIANIATHTPELPPCDIGDTNLIQTVMLGTNVVGQQAKFWNTSNPYGSRYVTFRESFGQRLEQFNDLLPLDYAQTDEDMPMWDNGTIPALTSYDSDGDGMPDAWEELYGLDPLDATGVNGAYGDADHDGLSNLAEYLAGTSPTTWDSKGTGFSDYDNRSGPGARTYGELYDDGDGMPGSWEIKYPGPCLTTGKPGLDPTKYDGDQDPDEDGWDNYSEYMAGTDPLNSYDFPDPLFAIHVRYHGRWGNSLPEAMTTDADTHGGSTLTTVGLGELQATYSPPIKNLVGSLQNGDVEPGTVEFQLGDFRQVVTTDPFTGEVVTNYVGSTICVLKDDMYGHLSGTLNGTSVSGIIDYSSGGWSIDVPSPGFLTYGQIIAGYKFWASGQLKLQFYKTPAMDGWPSATLNMDSEYKETRVFDTGHLAQGSNYVFAYLDMNKNNKWDPDTEPAGIGQFQPLNVGWGLMNNIEIGLSDSMPGYPRFTWSAVAGASSYILTNSVLGIGKTIAAPRNYWHEGDWLNVGTYGATGTVVFLVYANNLTTFVTNTVSIVNSSTLSAPSIVTPYDSYLNLARNEIEFKVDPNATSYRMQVALSSNATPVLSVTNIVPFKDINGVSDVALPFYAGDNYVPLGGNYASSVWTNGRYWIRVQEATPAASVSSPWSAINLDVQPPPTNGKSMVSGDLYYFGKVSHGYGTGPTATNLTMIVQAFQSPGFSGVADAQVQVGYNCHTNAPATLKGSYTMKGLPNNVYYVRAFIDENGNRQLDSWEPVGYARVNNASTDYDLLPVDLTGETGQSVSGVRVTIRDRDTDGDKLPDGWEWMYYGTLARGSLDTGTNGLTLLKNYSTEPMDLDPTKDDYDGDGVPDRIEIDWAHARSQLPADRATIDWSTIVTDPTHAYNPYDPVSNPTGTDLSAAKWDTDGDGLSDGYEIAHGLDPLDPTDGAAQIAKAKALGETIPGIPSISRVVCVSPDSGQFSLTWEGQIGMTYQVQYSDDLKTWQDAPGGLRYYEGTHAYIDSSPSVTTRFYRVVVK